MAVVLVVSSSEAHVGHLSAVVVQGKAAGVTGVFEGSVALVDVEIVGRGVVGYQEIHFAVSIHVGKQRTEAVVPCRIVHTQLLAHIGKRSVPVVMEEMILLSAETAGTAHALFAAVVTERGASGPRSDRHTGSFRCVGKCSIVVVAIEAVFAIVGHVQIGPAVIVVIAYCAAVSPAGVGGTGFGGHLGERAVVVVVKERGVRRFGFTGERVVS